MYVKERSTPACTDSLHSPWTHITITFWWKIWLPPLQPPLPLIYFDFSVFVLLTPIDVCHTRFPPFFSWGHARWVQARGECSLWWATDQNNWYFFIKTHVHPPTHRVTHVCTVTHTHTHRQRSLLFEDPWRERCSYSLTYFDRPSIDRVCPALDPDRQWNRPCVDAAHELRHSNFFFFFSCLDLKQ